MNYLDFIQAGFHGFAFIMFYLSYKRLGDVAKLTMPDHVDSERELAVYQQEVGLRYKSLWLLMAVSLVFFIVGIGAQLYSHTMEHKISVQLIPHQLPEDLGAPKLTLTGKQESVFEPGNSTGQLQVPVAHKDQLIITIDGLSEYLLKLQKEKATAELALVESRSSEAGFGNDYAIPARPGSLESKWRAADLAIKKGDYAQARRILNEAGVYTIKADRDIMKRDIVDNRKHYYTYQRMGNICLGEKKPDKAVKWMDTLVSIKKELRIDDGEIYNLMGYIYAQIENLDKAEEYFKLTLNTKERVGEEARKKALNNLARVQLEMGKLEESEKNYQLSVKKHDSKLAREALTHVHKVKTQAKVLKVDPAKISQPATQLRLNPAVKPVNPALNATNRTLIESRVQPNKQ